MLMRTYSSDDATSARLQHHQQQQQKRIGIQLGTKTLIDSSPKPTNVQPTAPFSPQTRRARAVAGRQRRLTDSMVLDEASDTYLRAFSEQVTRLKRLTDGLQRFDNPTSTENENRQNNMNNFEDNDHRDEMPLENEYEGIGSRSNWGALSSSLASGYRLRSSSTSATVDGLRVPLTAAIASGTSNGTHHHTKNGDAINSGEVQWQKSEIMPSISTNRPIPNSSTLPTTPTASFYECTTSIEELPYPSGQNSTNRYVANGMNEHREPRMGDRRSAAPLAKPEPLADLEKPAFDNRQFSKQAATAMPQQRRFGSSTIYNQNKDRDFVVVPHQKTIRFADEEDDDLDDIENNCQVDGDDLGMMSEAETSATSGTNSAVRRRQIVQQKNPNWQNQNQQPENSIRQSNASPSIQRRPPGRESIQQHNYLHVVQPVSNSVTIANSPKCKSGVVFLQFQGETKRSVLPNGHDATSKSTLHTMDDVRILFLKAFQTEMTPEYLQSPLVKIYIQDPSKTDVFYELDDLNDVKDRAILKLHECPTRPNSPPPSSIGSVTSNQSQPIQQQQSNLLSPPVEHRRVVSPLLERAAANEARASPRQQLANELRSVAIGYQSPHNYHQHQSSSASDDMNYFSEPEFDGSGDYRLRKSSSTSNYCVSPAYQLQQVDQRRHYGTIDRYYGSGPGDRLTSLNRASYRPQQQVPPKPERHFGPGIPSGGRTSMRRSQSPPRVGVLSAARPTGYGHSTDPEEAYGIRGGGGSNVSAYRDYAPSPTSDLLMDTYNRPPSVSRSGSVTPVIDEEARIRMINMEKQLANLSTLVHSALMSKGQNETVYKDLEMLRREILGGNGGNGSLQSANGSSANGTRDDISDSGSVSRFSDVSSEKGSYQANAERDATYTSSAPFTPISVGNGFTDPSANSNGQTNGANAMILNTETRHALRNCKRRVGEIQTELKNLRRLAQLNAQSSRDILKDAFDRIKVILNTNKHLHMFAQQAQQQNQAAATALSSDRNWADQEQDRYRKSIQRVEKELGDLEKQVEEMRQKVINGERKLRMSEVESFTDMLGQIGRLAAHLKTNFPMLQDRLKQVMGAEMEKVVREEKFLKDEPTRVDTALKRCKKLTNTMVTMKKLAMVQDPAAYYGNSNRSQTPVKQPGATDIESAPQNGASNLAPPIPPPPPEYRRTVSPPKEDTIPTKSLIGANNVAIVAPSPAPKPIGAVPAGGHVLDSLLEELQNVAKTTSLENTHTNLSNGNSSPHPPPPSSINNGHSTEKNGLANGNGERRVGFADEVQIHNHESNADSDTIKRAPKPTSGFTNSPQPHVNNNHHPYDTNSILSRRSNGATNGFPTYSNNPPTHLAGIGARRRSASPLLASSAPPTSNVFMYNQGLRSHSGTPSSVISDSAAYQHHHSVPPPPPPPRSSSRTMLAGNGNGNSNHTTDGRFKNFDLDELKQQLMSSPGMNGGSKAMTAIVQTNAVDDEPKLLKSASSSESVNSQDGRRPRHRQGEQLLMSPPGKPPPPPPPPRNKQEMLEQRQHELLTKQMQQQQNRYTTKYQL